MPARPRSWPRTRPPAVALAVRDALGGDLVAMRLGGGEGRRGGRDGRVEVYVHAGGQYEWDSAALVAVVRAAGLHTSRIDGSALAANQPKPTAASTSPGVSHPACRRRLESLAVLEALR